MTTLPPSAQTGRKKPTLATYPSGPTIVRGALQREINFSAPNKIALSLSDRLLDLERFYEEIRAPSPMLERLKECRKLLLSRAQKLIENHTPFQELLKENLTAEYMLLTEDIKEFIRIAPTMGALEEEAATSNAATKLKLLDLRLALGALETAQSTINYFQSLYFNRQIYTKLLELHLSSFSSLTLARDLTCLLNTQSREALLEELENWKVNLEAAFTPEEDARIYKAAIEENLFIDFPISEILKEGFEIGFLNNIDTLQAALEAITAIDPQLLAKTVLAYEDNVLEPAKLLRFLIAERDLLARIEEHLTLIGKTLERVSTGFKNLGEHHEDPTPPTQKHSPNLISNLEALASYKEAIEDREETLAGIENLNIYHEPELLNLILENSLLTINTLMHGDESLVEELEGLVDFHGISYINLKQEIEPKLNILKANHTADNILEHDDVTRDSFSSSEYLGWYGWGATEYRINDGYSCITQLQFISSRLNTLLEGSSFNINELKQISYMAKGAGEKYLELAGVLSHLRRKLSTIDLSKASIAVKEHELNYIETLGWIARNMIECELNGCTVINTLVFKVLTLLNEINPTEIPPDYPPSGKRVFVDALQEEEYIHRRESHSKSVKFPKGKDSLERVRIIEALSAETAYIDL